MLKSLALKCDGRIEYRSLPNNIKPQVLINGIREALANAGFDN
jgi:autonomous glycyl radical cofactor GrcA